MDEKTRLAYYRKSLQSAWGYNDYNDWPIKVNSVMHIFLQDFAKEFLTDLEETKERNFSTLDIAKAFGNPARFYRAIDPVIFGMKRLRIDIEEQRKVVLSLLDIVKKMKYGSEFNEDGSNIILTPDELNNLIGRINLKKADASAASIIQRFCGVMWAYTEAIFFRAHDVTKEIHGPYSMGSSGEKFVVREYLHLQPYEIWDQVPFIPYKNIKIYTIYKEELNVTIDSYNHLFLHGGNYVNDLMEYALEVDGEMIGPEKLMEILPLMQKAIETVHQWVGKADWHARVNRYADIYWYRKSPIRRLLGKDWGVPESVREKIANGNADPKRLNNLSDDWIDRLIQIVI